MKSEPKLLTARLKPVLNSIRGWTRCRLKNFDAFQSDVADDSSEPYNGGLKSVLDFGVEFVASLPLSRSPANSTKKKFYDYCDRMRQRRSTQKRIKLVLNVAYISSPFHERLSVSERDVLSRRKYICRQYPVIRHCNVGVCLFLSFSLFIRRYALVK